jgi:hypothetical protein
MKFVFTFTVRDEQIYQRLMDRVNAQGGSLDDVLRDLLDEGDESGQAEDDALSPALKLLSLIDAADLRFEHPFEADEAGDILRAELGDLV